MQWRHALFILPIVGILLTVTGGGPWLPQPVVQVWIPIEPKIDMQSVPNYQAGPSNVAHAAVLLERTTGTILFGENMHTQRAPASTTKIMTALVAIELGNMNDIVTVSRKAAGVRGSSARLYVDQKIRLVDLMHGLLLNSGNDASVAIAEHIAGSEEAFVAIMNERAKELGLLNTQFRNPHGLDEPGHVSTAFDLAILTDTAMNYPLFSEIVAKREYASQYGAWRNTNQLLWSMEGVEGVKTGTTGQAGYCLVAAISREGMQLISVVLGSSDRWSDSIRLLNHGFDNFQRLTVIERGAILSEIDLPTAMQPLVAIAEKPFAVIVRSDQPAEIDLRTVFDSLKAPIRSGQRIGTVEVAVNASDEPIRIPLVAKADVVRRTPWRILWQWITSKV